MGSDCSRTLTLCRTGAVRLCVARPRSGCAICLRLTKKSRLRIDGAEVPGGAGRLRPAGVHAAQIREGYCGCVPYPARSCWRRYCRTLAKAGLADFRMRGANGGYALARACVGKLRRFEVIRAIDGAAVYHELHHDSRKHATWIAIATIKEPLRKVNDSIKDLLSGNPDR